MSRNFYIVPTAPQQASKTARFGTDNTTANNFDYKEMGKIVKLTGDSQYNLAAAGDEIEGFITSIEQATQNGWSIGGFYAREYAWVLADGLQATAGTGAIAVGDYVLCGTVTAKGTALAGKGLAKVVKATSQTTSKTTPFAWRCVSLGPVGTGAVATAIVIERAASN